ncbi:hypothetical protein [Phyllobacterium leguminum]|uniref:hypothetical protein n=1 Tax=Phyllobacterium leguminum TaxID=314237 RepID=UPI000DA1E5C7|nr:hypothetical protein [Phyllobacterium leguminum]
MQAFAENSRKILSSEINLALTKDSVGIDGKVGLPLRLRKADAVEEDVIEPDILPCATLK